ncbi:alpha/beta hydrolase [Microbacterium pumilum]|uniref:alpha/beta hydrolase n=1 Tax=Microbacterium pumilum TaxID=344165 RepID=UPI0031E31D54
MEGIRLRIYKPAESGTARPLIVYFHGGGFVYGDLRGGDWMCGTVAKGLDAIVVSVEYRLAPKHPFPAGVDDCFAMLIWAAHHARELGADADRLGVMGESAGGNLAAVAALMARDNGGPRIRHQALLYPATGAGETESRRANADAYILTAADMATFGELYGGDVDDWRVSPLKAESLAGLPATTVIVGGHDPLHDDGVNYADALREAGVGVQLIEYPAMPHGFLNFPRFARDADTAMTAVVNAQRSAFG